MTLIDQEHAQERRENLSDEEIARRYPTAHAEALYWRRRRLKLSLEEAAAALALEPAALERIERGELAPNDDQLTRIAALYRFDLDVLRADLAPAQDTANDAPATQDASSTLAR